MNFWKLSRESIDFCSINLSMLISRKLLKLDEKLKKLLQWDYFEIIFSLMELVLYEILREKG